VQHPLADAVSGNFGEIPASLEECEYLEVAAVWDGHHVEDRLRDHFDGRPSEWVESMRLNRWPPEIRHLQIARPVDGTTQFGMNARLAV
jgi:hypothetical protein